MKIEQKFMLATALACALLVFGGSHRAAGEATGRELMELLPAGGYVIYQRHALTDTTRGDADPIDIKDCSTQRSLSDAGRALARKIGEAFRAVHIPVDHIVASPYCRAVETAALEFPLLQRTTSDALWYSLALPKDQAEKAAAEVKQMLATPPLSGTNTLIVGHTSNLQEAAGVWPKKEGGIIVFRPDGHGGFALLGSIDPIDLESAAN
jgi:phosphohistidine phosphatase SixA